MITLNGNNFYSGTGVTAIFGSEHVNTSFVDSTQLRVLVPALVSGNYLVSFIVSETGETYIDDVFTFSILTNNIISEDLAWLVALIVIICIVVLAVVLVLLLLYVRYKVSNKKDPFKGVQIDSLAEPDFESLAFGEDINKPLEYIPPNDGFDLFSDVYL